MRLRDLNPQFVKVIDDRTNRHVDTVAEAEGIMFVCPRCYQTQGNTTRGAHSILCWRPHIPQTKTPQGGRWEMSGTGYDDLTLSAQSSSILLPGPGCGAHFFIRDGEIIFT